MGVTGGVENLDEQFGWDFLGMLVLVPLFGWISGRFRRAVFLPWTYLFSWRQLVAILGAVHRCASDDAAVARVFFIWVSVINLPLIAVFWSFMADLFDKEQGKRLFAFITAGASVGRCWARPSPPFSAKVGWRGESAAGLGVAARRNDVPDALPPRVDRALESRARRADGGAAHRRQSVCGPVEGAEHALPGRDRGHSSS